MTQAKVICDPLKKRALNKMIFSLVAKEYMLVTQLLSFFRDKAWKTRMVSVLPIFKKDDVVVDVASGTGDIARLIVVANPEVHLVGCDLTFAMLTIAKSASLSKNVFYSCQDMNALGLKQESAACITGGYALRNAPDLTTALAQFHNVLKQEGIAAFLDFSKSSFPPLAHLQIAALRLWGGFWGLVLHGKPWVYGYIGDSLKQFPDRNTLHTLFKNAGFFVVASQFFMFGFIELTIVKKVSRKSV